MKNSLAQFDIPRVFKFLHESVIEKMKNIYSVITVCFQLTVNVQITKEINLQVTQRKNGDFNNSDRK